MLCCYFVNCFKQSIVCLWFLIAYTSILPQWVQAEDTHQPILKNQAFIGYPIVFFNEKLGTQKDKSIEVNSEVPIFTTFRLGGLLRLYNVVAFGDYSLFSQPVNPLIITEENGQEVTKPQEGFNRLTHQVDLGLGYAFPVLPNQLELTPFAGLMLQSSSNDKSQLQDNIYYNVAQSRVAFGGGIKLAWQFADSYHLILSGGYYPVTSILTSSTKVVNFPNNLSLIALQLQLVRDYSMVYLLKSLLKPLHLPALNQVVR